MATKVLAKIFAQSALIFIVLVSGRLVAAEPPHIDSADKPNCLNQHARLAIPQLKDNEAVFESDQYGGKAYERGVMAYGTKEDGGGWWGVQMASKQIIKEELLKRREQSQNPIRLLDVGSGPGFTLAEITSMARQLGVGGLEVSGIELNDKMLAYSKEAYGVDVKKGDMHELSVNYSDFSVDIIHSQSVLWISKQPKKIAREIGKVVKPGGLLTFTWMVRRKSNRNYDNYESWYDAFKNSVMRSVSGGRISLKEAEGVLEANRTLVLDNNINSPRDPVELIDLFRSEGFDLEELNPHYIDSHGKPFFYQYVFRKRN